MKEKRELLHKLTAARASLLLKAPFYGTLLMHLKFGLADCGTACTDMKRILWDPEFLRRISQEEVEFVMLHEVMHCVLNHIYRGRDKIQKLYNVAADIVVNSSIMELYAVETFCVDGVPAMHLAPDGREGLVYNAEQVYDMLLQQYGEYLEDMETLCGEIASEYGGKIDSHAIWDMVPLSERLPEEWKQIVKETAKNCFSKDMPSHFVRKLLDSADYNSVIDWRQILNDFIQIVTDTYDFSFAPADRRFSSGEFILPSFHELEGEAIENIWILIDNSGSIDNKTLTAVLQEIKSAVSQFSHLCAKISCFDTAVTDPVLFESVEDLQGLDLYGGGGTSFYCIFNYLTERMIEDLPAAIVIITDGYAIYPDEKAAMDIPVLWMLINNDRDAPWGKSVHVDI